MAKAIERTLFAIGAAVCSGTIAFVAAYMVLFHIG